MVVESFVIFIGLIILYVGELRLENVRLVMIVNVSERVPAEIEPFRRWIGDKIHLLVSF